MSELSTEPIIQTYFNQENILSKHQVESYDDFVENIIPNILDQFSPVVVNMNDNIHKIKNVKMYLLTDTIIIDDCKYNENNGVEEILYPNIAILRNYSYMADVLIDIKISIEIVEHGKQTIYPDTILKNVIIGNIPIMVGSKFCMNTKFNKTPSCKYDIGGYFIINGNEKVIISQEKIATNIIQVFESKKDKYAYVSEIRSINENKFCIPKCISIKITNKPSIYNNEICINIPNITNPLPIFVIFKLLGCITDKEILYNIIDNSDKKTDDIMTNILLPSFEKIQNITNELDAYRYIINNLNTNYYNISEEKKNRIY